MKRKSLFLILPFIICLAGCSTIGESDFATKVPVQLGTIQLIKASSAQAVFDTAQEVKGKIEAGLPVADIKQFLLQEIYDAQLPLETSYVLREVMEELWGFVDAVSMGGEILPEAKPRLFEIIGYIEAETKFHGAK